MVTNEILDYLQNNGCDVDSMRTAMRITRMTTDEEINRARFEVVRAYITPALEFTAESELPEDFAKVMQGLIYARLLYVRLYKTEYTTAKPSKLNSTEPTNSEVVRQIKAFRRFAISVLIRLYQKATNKTLPRFTPILGEEI